MTAAPPEFVQRFNDAWKKPLTLFPALFDSEGTFFQSGMERPLSADEIAAHQESTLRLLPDFRVQATHWAECGNDVFIEWAANGTFGGQCVAWSGASRFTLRNGLVIEEVAFFDTLPLRVIADPSLGRRDLVGAALETTASEREAALR